MKPMSARPDSSAVFASVCFSKLETLRSCLPAAVQLSLPPDIGLPPICLPIYAQASPSSVVPVSTAMVWPHMSAALLTVMLLDAATTQASPAL